jgi:hypothetical protein
LGHVASRGKVVKANCSETWLEISAWVLRVDAEAKRLASAVALPQTVDVAGDKRIVADRVRAEVGFCIDLGQALRHAVATVGVIR